MFERQLFHCGTSTCCISLCDELIPVRIASSSDIIWISFGHFESGALQTVFSTSHVRCPAQASAARLRPMGPSVASRLCIASLRVLRCCATKLRYTMSPLSLLSEGTYFLWACLMELRNHNLKQGCKEASVTYCNIYMQLQSITCMCFMFCSPPKYCKNKTAVSHSKPQYMAPNSHTEWY